jgi:hypothetical protein
MTTRPPGIGSIRIAPTRLRHQHHCRSKAVLTHETCAAQQNATEDCPRSDPQIAANL